MDAYIPITETTRPLSISSQVGELWERTKTTRSRRWQVHPGDRPGRPHRTDGNPSVVFSIVDTALSAGLARLRTFREWEENWDAEGGRAPDRQALDFATRMLGLLSVREVPDVTLTADGHAMFVFSGPLTGEVVVTGPTTFDYFFIADAAPDGENASLDGDSLPAELADFLTSAA